MVETGEGYGTTPPASLPTPPRRSGPWRGPTRLPPPMPRGPPPMTWCGLHVGSRILQQAADAYDRAARPPYGRIPPPTPAGNRLRQAARIMSAFTYLTHDRSGAPSCYNQTPSSRTPSPNCANPSSAPPRPPPHCEPLNASTPPPARQSHRHHARARSPNSQDCPSPSQSGPSNALVPLRLVGLDLRRGAVQPQNQWLTLERAEHQGHPVDVQEMRGGLIAAAGAVQPDDPIGPEDTKAIQPLRRDVHTSLARCCRHEEHVLGRDELRQSITDLAVLLRHRCLLPSDSVSSGTSPRGCHCTR